jgi:hypothetical protein
VWRDIAAKRKATRYLHEPPLLVEAVGHCDQTANLHPEKG